MARFLPGPLISNISGSVGGQTFATGPGGLMVRQRSSPTQPQSPAQQAVRQSLSNVSKSWSDVLTDAQRQSWIDFAAANPIPGAFGEPMVLSGIGMYVRLNQQLVQGESAMISNPPLDLVVPSITTLSCVPDATLGDFDVVYTATPLPANVKLVVFATQSLSQGITQFGNFLRQVFVSAAAAASPQDIFAGYVGRFGALGPVGAKVGIEAFLLDATKGATSPVLRASGTIV